MKKNYLPIIIVIAVAILIIGLIIALINNDQTDTLDDADTADIQELDSTGHLPVAIADFNNTILEELCDDVVTTTVDFNIASNDIVDLLNNNESDSLVEALNNATSNVSHTRRYCKTLDNQPADGSEDIIVDTYVASKASSAEVESLLTDVFTPRQGSIIPINQSQGECRWRGNVYIISNIPVVIPLAENSLTMDADGISGAWMRIQFFGISGDRYATLDNILEDNDFQSYVNNLPDDREIPDGYELQDSCVDYDLKHFTSN